MEFILRVAYRSLKVLFNWSSDVLFISIAYHVCFTADGNFGVSLTRNRVDGGFLVFSFCIN